MALLACGARAGWCGILLLALLGRDAFAAPAPTEEQVKAVFVFNFSHFVEWPAQSFASPTDPFVIGVLDDSAFADRLDEVVKGEKIEQHALTVRRFRNIAELKELKDCQILYVDKTQAGQLRQVIAALAHGNTLTVSDADKSAEHGVMMQFVTESNRIRLRINVEAARVAGLTISSKLLRPAEIVTAVGD